MSFANLQLLWLLPVILPALVVFFWWSWRARKRLVTQFIQARLLPGLTIGISPQRQKIRLACMVLAVACIIVALAGLRFGFDWEEAKQRGLDIVVAIDTSKSMLAEDIAPNRLERAKLAALDLMQQAKSDRLGLVVFAGSAFLQCPLTIDDAAFSQSVKALDVNTIPQGGTALAEAIETTSTAFKEGENFKVLVLFTDGEDQDSGAVEAAKKAAKAGLQIFTIGIGSAEGELLRIRDAKGRTDYIRDDQGNVVKSHLNETLLREIATESKGFYLPLRGAKTIDTLYKEGLAPLPKSESKEKLVKHYHERFQLPLALAMLFLLAEMFFPERKREPQPRPAVPAAPKPALREAVTILLLLLLPTAVLGSTASALREYNSGKYDLALKEYDRLLERKSDDPRLYFNAGAAAYRSRKFEQAAKRFNDALNAPDLKLQQQAYYNRGNTFYQIGKNIPDLPKQIETWEKSLKDYQSALKLNPQDADAKFNYEFVKRKIEEAKQEQKQEEDSKNTEPSEEAKKAKAEADRAVERREYAKALQIMETQLQQDPTTRYYSGYMKRLKEVNEAQDPSKP